MSEISVYMLDDNPDFLRNTSDALSQMGFVVKTFQKIDTFESELFRAPHPFVVFIDHDLGCQDVGYDVVRRLRQTHPDGEFLPIVYLTGRESVDGYLAAERDDPDASPSLYLSKRGLISVDFNDLINRLVNQFESQMRIASQHSAKRAIRSLLSPMEDMEEDRG